MSSRRRASSGRLAVLRWCVGFGLMLVLAGCEKGCLWRMIPRAGLKAVPGGPGEPSAAWFGMGEVDCPDGLARCRGGVVQVSARARRPLPCSGNPEACACPWITGDPCSGPCVADDLEIAVPPERALAQLCAPAPASPPFARSLPLPGGINREGERTGGEEGIEPNHRSRPPALPVSPLWASSGAPGCEGEAFVCLGSSVLACKTSTRSQPELVGTCIAGCTPDSALGGAVAEQLQPAQALAILCTR